MRVVATVLQLAGLAGVVAGAALVSVAAAVAAGGGVLVFVGLAMER